METLTRQPDGFYALTFKNYNNVSEEETKKIFNKYGTVASIRKSSEQVPWVFIRYKAYEEALAAYKDLQSCKHFEIRVATSGRKVMEQGGSDRERSDNHKGDSREKGHMKGNRTRNNFVDRSPRDDGGDDDVEPMRSPPQRLSTNRRGNHFAERSAVDVDDDHNENVDDDGIEAVGSSLKRTSLHGDKKLRKGNRDEAEDHREIRSNSPSRVIRKAGSVSSGGARSRPNNLEDDGPPKLVKAAEFYGSLTQQHRYESGLACRAVFNEVWANHPLRGEMELREVVIANFRATPTKRELVEICAGVKLLHITVGKTPRNMPFCRVLVATEEEAEELYKLDGCEYKGLPLYASSLEYILDELWE